jgi:peptidoglycan/LPS O-acetylase OafA/YrhL
VTPSQHRVDDAGALDAPGAAVELRYQPFVDGLRAISILSVVAYHIGVPGVPGGFVGVDIFFVVSGYLIINQIKAGLTAGRFTITSFYAQRSLRILPAYFLVLLVTFAAAPFFLATPSVYWDFLSSAMLAPMMVSNVIFFLHQRYFDISGIEKPLLHTWTLSVEEQFYCLIPALLMLIFYFGRRRFGAVAAWIGIILAVASFASAILETSTTGRNAGFYLAHCRAWEFAIGGFIGPYTVSAIRRLPRWIIEVLAWAGGVCIAVAILKFDAGIPYPSTNAALPVAGAALVILCGTARPDATLVRVLSLQWMVAIGLVSYAWYLWHWPILSFTRMARLQDASLLYDTLTGGLLGLILAYATYRYLEQPIHRWRKTPGNIKNPLRIFIQAFAACVMVALIGGASVVAGYPSIKTLATSRYGIDGQGVLPPKCRLETGFPESCLQGRLGVIIGDSHATVLVGPFAKKFDALGTPLVSLAQGACGPLLLAPPSRKAARTDRCARLIAPAERLLARKDPIDFAVITGIWSDSGQTSALLPGLISNFDPRTRILLIGPVPIFASPGLECVVLSDRYRANRDHCIKPRGEVDAARAAVQSVLKSMPEKFPNVRYIDPIGVFCDETTCRPFKGDEVHYLDTHHLSPAGADRLYEAYKSDFLWLAGKP